MISLILGLNLEIKSPTKTDDIDIAIESVLKIQFESEYRTDQSILLYLDESFSIKMFILVLISLILQIFSAFKIRVDFYILNKN